MKRALRELVTSMPDVRLVAVCTLGRHMMAAARTAWLAGIRTVIVHPYDDVALVIRRALNRTILDDAERRIMALLPPRLTVEDLRTIRCCVRHAHRRPTVKRVAERLRVSERMLVRRCRATHLPPPEELISRCRILMALEVSRPRPRSLDHTSTVFGFRDVSDLRTKIKRRTGLTVGQARLLQNPTDLLFLAKPSGRTGPQLERPLEPTVVAEGNDRPAQSPSWHEIAAPVSDMATGVSDMATGARTADSQC